VLLQTANEGVEVSVGTPTLTGYRLAISLRHGWILGKLLLAGLLAVYAAGWVQDVQRIRRLEAEPTPPSKIITKQEAWQRIHNHSMRPSTGTLPHATSRAIRLLSPSPGIQLHSPVGPLTDCPDPRSPSPLGATA
jgi:hypothetical protein